MTPDETDQARLKQMLLKQMLKNAIDKGRVADFEIENESCRDTEAEDEAGDGVKRYKLTGRRFLYAKMEDA